MKSRLGYVLAAAVVVAGVGLGVWVIFSGLTVLQNALTRVVVPGTSELTLDKTGTYTIFHEAESVVDGTLYSVQNIAGLRVTVTSEADGKQIAVVTPSGSSSYSIAGHSGVSVLAFEIAQPGRYRLTAAYANGQSEPQTVLAVGSGFVWTLVRTILSAIGVVFLGFAGALALALTTFLRRRRMSRAATA